jgi:hypothetical protein
MGRVDFEGLTPDELMQGWEIAIALRISLEQKTRLMRQVMREKERARAQLLCEGQAFGSLRRWLIRRLMGKAYGE